MQGFNQTPVVWGKSEGIARSGVKGQTPWAGVMEAQPPFSEADEIL